MLVCCRRFNLYFVIVALVALVCACQSPEKKRKKSMSTLRVHIEGVQDASKRTVPVEIYRASPVTLHAHKVFFLNEENVKQAKVVDVPGGFALEIQLDRQGTWLLEQYTTGNRGKHLLIFSQFAVPSDPEKEEGRWLAAPLIKDPVTDGKLVFTPDATREEADQIAIGLNNASKKLGTAKESNF